jgi:hypothetical protein
LDKLVEIRDTDANKSTYTPKDGAKYIATDTGDVYLGDGSNWTHFGVIDSGETATTATKSGDGTKTTFTVTHDLGSVPARVGTTPTTEAASGDHWVTNKTDTSFDIVYGSAPPSGTDNLSWDLTLHE